MRPSLRKLAPLHSAADVPALPEVFILWHPDCAHGHPIAWQIRRWLRPSAGQGPQVFYRSQPAPGGGSRLPLPLPGEPRPWPPGIEPQMQRPKLQIVVLLLDHHMVTDPAWRWWMEQLSLPDSQRQGPPLLFLPVALTTTAFNAPVEIAKQNFMRIADVTALDPAALWVEPLQSPLLGSLLKPLTEALCRVVLAGPAIDAERSSRQSAALRLFISHAKVDGAGPASRLRDYIYSRTQLAAFFDENNIPYGDSFAAVLQRALADGETAALIAVVSDRYASRPWCRRELRTFCRPQRVMEVPVEVWAMHPVLVVDYLEGEQLTRGLAELATVPVLRWQDNLPGMRQEEMIVTLLLREIFFDGYARRVAQHFALTESGPRFVLAWRPDAVTLQFVMSGRPPGDLMVLYPGREITAADDNALRKLFPALTFMSFAEADMDTLT